jgi:hypothetical protein
MSRSEKLPHNSQCLERPKDGNWTALNENPVTLIFPREQPLQIVGYARRISIAVLRESLSNFRGKNGKRTATMQRSAATAGDATAEASFLQLALGRSARLEANIYACGWTR